MLDNVVSFDKINIVPVKAEWTDNDALKVKHIAPKLNKRRPFSVSFIVSENPNVYNEF